MKTYRNNVIQGKCRANSSTKQLLKTIEAKEIAVIKHEDLDEMGALGLIEAKVKAVINAAPTMTGKYPAHGAIALLRAGIPIFEISAHHFPLFACPTVVSIRGNRIVADHFSVPCRRFTYSDWQKLNEKAQENLGPMLSDFIDNTLNYARSEKQFVIRPLELPPLKTDMKDKHVVVVVRGRGYKNDLRAIKNYIEDYKPVLIGVDGGADALLEYGFTPDLIVGDMDSVSDDALTVVKERIVHAYPDGRAPGMRRIKELGLQAKVVAAPGTSEDLAMLIAYEKEAELIVTLGTHTHMIDFLEKGRKGMSSTMLVRMKIGGKLVDAKGVSKLYQRPPKLRNLWVIPVAGLFPLAMLGLIHPGFRSLLGLFKIYVKMMI